MGKLGMGMIGRVRVGMIGRASNTKQTTELASRLSETFMFINNASCL